jgi:hypothetical protein
MASTSIALRHWSSLSARPGTREARLSRGQAFALVLLAACLWGTSGTRWRRSRTPRAIRSMLPCRPR